MFDFVRRTIGPALLVVVAWLGAAAPGWAAGAVRKAPAPAWVAIASVPVARTERNRQVEDGLYFLLLDHQLRPGPPDVDYRRRVVAVTDRSGLEKAGAIDVDFDPTVDDLVLHHVRVIRNGVVQDRLPTVQVRLLQQEEELDQGVFTGRKTAHIELDDIRVGDIVDQAYSVATDAPQMAGHLYAGQSLTWAVPLGLTRFRVVWPHGRPVSIRRYGGAAEPRLTRAGAEDIYDWSVADHDPMPGEDNAPEWTRQWQRVTVSTFTSWAQVAAWSLPFYAAPDGLPASWAAEVDKIAKATADPYDRVTQALRLVQDHVRYVSLSMGPGGYQPRKPETVIRSGYGDCKDKALLLSVILRRLGIDAVPALTDTVEGPGLPEVLPSASAFDHAIVRIRLKGQTYWVDPTRSHAGGRFPGLSPIRYAWALPIAPGQSKLEAIAAADASEPTTDVVERYELPNRTGAAMKLTVVTVYRGFDADFMRRDIADGSLADLEKKYVKFYAERYPGIRSVRDLEVADSRDNNAFTVREAYEVPASALADRKLLKTFPILASALNDYKSPPGGERRFPLQLAFPVNKHHRIELLTPGHKPPAPPSEDLEGAAFHLAVDAVRGANQLTIDYALRSRKELLEPARLEDFRGDVHKLDNATQWDLDLTSTAGGTIGEEDKVAGIVIMVVTAALALLGAVFGLRWGLRADDGYAADGRLYPVDPRKFLIMSFATAGLYDLFWAWKCWRWIKRHGRAEIAPFWRAVFQIVWLYPLFEDANERLGKRALPGWWGAAGALAYAAVSMANVAVEKVPALNAYWLPVLLLSPLCVLPAVLAIRRLNADAPDVVRANSRLTRHSLVAIGAGGLWWALIIYGAYAG